MLKLTPSNTRSVAIAIAAGAVVTLALTFAPRADAESRAPVEIAATLDVSTPNVLCRGPFTLTQYKNYIILFAERNRSRAGARGEKLAPSACALEDRRLAANEHPTVIVHALSPTKADDLWYPSAVSQITQCAASSSCLLRVGRLRNGDPNFPTWFLEEAGELTTSWHDFRAMAKTTSTKSGAKGKVYTDPLAGAPMRATK